MWIWSQEMPDQIGPAARRVLARSDTHVYVSPVSSLEIARLAWGGRLSLAGPLQSWVSESLEALLAETVPLPHGLAGAAYELPGEFHRDPVDRMLVATARVNDLALMTADERILAYPHVRSLDARA